MRTYTAFRHRQPQWVVIRTGLPRFARSDGPYDREVGGGVMCAGLPRCARSDGSCAREERGGVMHAGLPRFAHSDGWCAREERGGVMRTGLPRFARNDGPYDREVGAHAGLPRFARSDDLCVHRVMRWAAQPAELSHCAISVGSSCHREERSDVAIHDFFGGMCQDEHILGVTAC